MKPHLNNIIYFENLQKDAPDTYLNPEMAAGSCLSGNISHSLNVHVLGNENTCGMTIAKVKPDGENIYAMKEQDDGKLLRMQAPNLNLAAPERVEPSPKLNLVVPLRVEPLSSMNLTAPVSVEPLSSMNLAVPLRVEPSPTLNLAAPERVEPPIH